MGLSSDDEKAKPFTVSIRNKDVVAPLCHSSLIQENNLPMSNLDFLLRSEINFASILCYKNPTTGSPSCSSGDSFIACLKKSLAQVLVAFYPLAGDVVQNTVGEPEIWCNNHGVDFIEAYADVELEKLNLYNFDVNFVVGKLVPEKKRGILTVQSTVLKCGSVVMVCLFDHRFIDGYSASMFIVSWAEFTLSKPLTCSSRPLFQRSLLNPHHLGRIDSFIHEIMYPDVVNNNPENPPPSNPIMSTRIFYIKAEHIIHLQTLASSSNYKTTKLVAFSAFLWKMIARITSFTSFDGEKLSRMAIIVDGRKLLDGSGGEDKMMTSYFGNVVSVPFLDKKVCDLNREPLSQVGNEVKNFLQRALTMEHFSGILDWVEELRPKSGLFRFSIYNSNDGPAIAVSSGLQFPLPEIDFGWGKPILGTYHLPMGMKNISKGGYVLPMLSPIGNGDWLVYMHLSTLQLELLEKEASHILKPLTFEYLYSTAGRQVDQSSLQPHSKNIYGNAYSKI